MFLMMMMMIRYTNSLTCSRDSAIAPLTCAVLHVNTEISCRLVRTTVSTSRSSSCTSTNIGVSRPKSSCTSCVVVRCRQRRRPPPATFHSNRSRRYPAASRPSLFQVCCVYGVLATPENRKIWVGNLLYAENSGENSRNLECTPE